MFIVYGVYHLWPKRVGFRNDYCLGCDKRRRSFALRTFDLGHVFWIPLVPFGYWKHWKCSECGRNPHAHVKTRRAFKWVALGCLILLSGVLWLTPIGSNPGLSNTGLIWLVRIAPAAGATVLLVHLLRSSAEPSLKERLAEIQPAVDVICPFCSTPLIASTGDPWTCPACSCVRY